MYRYRKWELGSGMQLIARTHLDAGLQQPNPSSPLSSFIQTSSLSPSETQFVLIKSLLEYDSKLSATPDWRQRLDAQRGAVLATECKNNGVKLAKWTLEALLAGADQIRLGFISRLLPKDRKKHVILGTGVYKPEDFLKLLMFDINSGWGILKTIVDMVSKLEDGKYILVKDPNKPCLKLYSVPLAELEKLGDNGLMNEIADE